MTDDTAEPAPFDPWRLATWEGHRDAQLASTLAATPAQRLAWLEEALMTAYRSGALPRDAADGPSRADTAR